MESKHLSSLIHNRASWLSSALAHGWPLVAALVFIHLAGLFGTWVLVPLLGWNTGVVDAPHAGTWMGRFVRWDSGYYLQIARLGYGYSSNGLEKAFFPLYPLLIRGAAALTGLSLAWSGILISWACFFLAGALLYRLVSLDHPPEIAQWALVWLAFFPVAFFFISLYTEALFVLLSLASVYHARRGRFLLSGVWICLAGSARPTAFLLAIPYLVEFWQQHDFSRPKIIELGLGGLVAPLGFIGFLSYLGRLAGGADLLALYTANLSQGFERYTTWPWLTIYDEARALLWGEGILPGVTSRILAGLELGFALLGLGLAVWSLFHLRRSLGAYLLAGVLFLYTSHGHGGYAFSSFPRYLAGLFPLYLALALITVRLPRPYRWLILAASLVLLFLLSAWFARGSWVA